MWFIFFRIKDIVGFSFVIYDCILFFFVGVSCYFRYFDYKRFREIVDENGVYVLVDMVYVSGFVVIGVVLSFFEYCDIVIIIIYKILRGLRSGMIFFRRGRDKVLIYEDVFGNIMFFIM